MSESANLLKLISQQAGNAQASAADLAVAESKNAKKAETILTEIERDQTTLGASQALVIRTVQGAALQAQQVQQKALESAGGFEAFYDIISQLATTTKRVQEEIKAVREEEASTVGFSPLGALKLAVDWSGNKSKLQSSISELQILNTAAGSIEQRLNQVGNLAKATSQSVTAASIEASASIVEKEAALQAARARLDGLKYNTAGTQAVASADEKMLALTLQAANFGRAEQQFELALREEDRRREDASFNRTLRQEALDNKAEEKATLETALFQINLGRASQNLPEISSRELQDDIKLNGGKLSPEYLEFRNNGRITAGTGQALISTSPGKVAAVLATNPNLVASLDENQKKVASLILEATSVLGLPQNKIQLADDKTGAKAQKLVAEQVNTLIQNQLRYVGNNPDNLFFIGEPSSYIGTTTSPGVAAFQNYALVQKVFNPAIATGTSLSDPNVSYQLTLEAVKKGSLTTSQAAKDYASIYQRMAALHRAGTDFRKFAIALPKEGSRYVVKIGGEVVDVTNFQAVAAAMNKDLARSAFSDYRTGKRVNPGLLKETERNLGIPKGAQTIE